MPIIGRSRSELLGPTALTSAWVVSTEIVADSAGSRHRRRPSLCRHAVTVTSRWRRCHRSGRCASSSPVRHGRGKSTGRGQLAVNKSHYRIIFSDVQRMIISITYNDTFATVTAVAVILGSLFLPKYNSGASIPHWPWSKSPYIYLPSLFSGGGPRKLTKTILNFMILYDNFSLFEPR